MRRIAVALATAGGAGYAPVAPGTFGSAAGVVIYLLTQHWPAWAQVALVLAISVAGVWAANEAERHFGREDPGPVVIDEVAGQLVTLLLLGVGTVGIAAGFFVFRILDITKPWPVRRFEDLPGGLGIMADDLMAGVYGWGIMWAAVTMLPGVL
jgi:phosphatidylglycerophosphatase A